MSWKYVFNTSLKPTMWGHIDKAIAAAKYSGYEFLTWNGLIYTIEGKVTRFSIDDLK